MRNNVVVSQYFAIGDQVLWNPATRLAQLFYRTADVMTAYVDTPHGLHDTHQDEYDIDPVQFTVFVDALTRRYIQTDFRAKTSIKGFLSTALVLAQRAGLTVSALTEPFETEHENSWFTIHREELEELLAAVNELKDHIGSPPQR